MISKVFVGNLPWSVRTVELSALLTTMGLPFRSVKVIENRETGQSRGFAFVECDGEAEAHKIIDFLEGHVLEGRSLNANEARPKGPDEHPSGSRPDRGAGGDHGRTDRRRERRADRPPSFDERRPGRGGQRRKGHWD